METRSEWLVARNSASTGIHSDDFAQRQGFERAVVAGPNHLSFAATMFEAAAGPDWLARGRISARFVAPVYDGEALQVTSTPVEGDLQAFARWETRKRDGAVAVSGTAGWSPAEEPPPRIRESSSPAELLDLAGIRPGSRLSESIVVPREDVVADYCELNHDPFAAPGRVPTAYLTFLLFGPARRFLDHAGVGPGMWGEIDIRQHAPLVAGAGYQYSGLVLSVRRRAALEIIDFAFEARDATGALACAITHTHLIPHRDSEVAHARPA